MAERWTNAVPKTIRVNAGIMVIVLPMGRRMPVTKCAHALQVGLSEALIDSDELLLLFSKDYCAE